MKRLILIIAILPWLGFSQYQETLTSDRPGQAMSPYTVGKKTIQIQNGLSYGEKKFSGGKTQTLIDYLNLRVGVFERIELNASLYPGKETNWIGSSKSSQGFKVNQLNFAIRHNILKGKGWIPTLGVQAGLSLYNSYIQQLGYYFRFMGNHQWDWLSLSLNAGFEFPGEVTGPIVGWNYPFALNFMFTLKDNVFAFAEVFGSFSEMDQPDFDFGLAVVPFDDLQIDLFGGYLIETGRNGWFAELGFSYRLDWRPKS